MDSSKGSRATHWRNSWKYSKSTKACSGFIYLSHRCFNAHKNQERVHGLHDFRCFCLLIALLQSAEQLVEQLLPMSQSLPARYGHDLLVHLELLPRRDGVLQHVDFGHHGAERLVSQQFMNAKPFGIGGFHRIHSVDERLRRFFYASFRCKKRKRFPRIT